MHMVTRVQIKWSTIFFGNWNKMTNTVLYNLKTAHYINSTANCLICDWRDKILHSCSISYSTLYFQTIIIKQLLRLSQQALCCLVAFVVVCDSAEVGKEYGWITVARCIISAPTLSLYDRDVLLSVELRCVHFILYVIVWCVISLCWNCASHILNKCVINAPRHTLV